jgi:hypothetical protein
MSKAAQKKNEIFRCAHRIAGLLPEIAALQFYTEEFQPGLPD